MSVRSLPNVIQIVVDDMGYGDVGTFNEGLTSTPGINELLAESRCFSQAYAASPVCNPSRAALMTGRYPMRTGSVDTLEWRGLERLALRETTAGDLYKAAGYATGLIGKWHLGAFDNRYHPKARGFDETVCFRGGMHDYYDWRLEYDHTIKRADGRYLTDLWTDEAVSFLQRHKDGPFFLHLAYNAPHTPLQVPEEELRPFLGKAGINPAVATLYAMLSRLDKGISRVLETVRKLGIEDNTIIMFTSDNGPQFDNGTRNGGDENNESLERFNCGLHGSKGSVWEGGIKVPLSIKWPEGIKGGTCCDQMVHFVDILPTLMSLCDIKQPESPLPIDGLDFSCHCKGENSELSERTRFWQWNRYTPVPRCNTAIREGDWKLVVPEIPEAMTVFDAHHLKTSMYEPEYFIDNGIITDQDPHRELSAPLEPELYSIGDDPGELKDLAAEHPQRVARMLSSLDSWYEQVSTDYRTARGE